MPNLILLHLLIVLCLLTSAVAAQDSASQGLSADKLAKAATSIEDRVASVEEKLEGATDKYLDKLLGQEQKLKRKLWKKDSALAKQLFTGVEEKYAALKNAPAQVSKLRNVYSPRLDSLTTSLKFLEGQNIPGLPDFKKNLTGLSSLQGKLNQTEAVKRFLQERKRLLKENLERVGMIKQLKGFNKQAYYYASQVREIKAMWEDPAKLEQKLLELAMKSEKFKEFFRQNSQLGSLFALPGSGAGNAAASLAGLQTRASVQAGLVQRFGSGSQVQQLLQQNMQAAQGQLTSFKNQLAKYGTGSFGNSGGGDIEMPEGFKPNGQKTKTFLQRLEYGFNIQSQKARGILPTTSDIGLSLGYKLTDNGSVGIGVAYKMGWGRGWNHIRISHEGLGLRSYVDWKLKGSIYITGGYEQNYNQAFQSIEQLKGHSGWQTSGLLGLSKKYKVSKKIKGDMKLLWDLMSYDQLPRTQPLLFRIGYSLK